MDMKEWLEPMLTEGGFGLEEENQRVTPDGFLAGTPHPFGNDPHMDRDFCESQLEIITGVSSSPEETVKELGLYKKKAAEILTSLPGGREYLWPFSNPPYIRDIDDIQIAQFEGELAEKTKYREYLAEKYGKLLESLCGIHFNYSYPKKFITFLKENHTDPDQIYLNLAEKILAHAWLIVALTAASPVYDFSFLQPGKTGITKKGTYSSVRCSEKGYWNTFEPVLDFTDINSFVETMESYVSEGRLYSTAELYYPVRLKPHGSNSLNGLRDGINHIELRMIDVNPLFREGINVKDVEFLAVLITYLTGLPKMDLSVWQQRQCIRNMKRAAHYPLEEIEISLQNHKTIPLTQCALHVLNDMEAVFGKLEIIEFQKEKILNPRKRYTTQIIREFGKDYVKSGLAAADKMQNADLYGNEESSHETAII